MTYRSLQRGFTLIEVLVVVAIVAIMATIAAPSFATFINDTRVKSIGTTLLNDINVARSEAIKINSRVAICGANATATDCAGTTSWANGWIVCVEDVNAAGTCDAAKPIISVKPAIANGVTVSSGSINAIIYRPTGAAVTAETITVQGTSTSKIAKVELTGFVSYH